MLQGEDRAKTFVPRAFGWEKDPPDFRDYGLDHSVVREQLARLPRCPEPVPPQVDLLEYLPDAEDQQDLNSSSACACVQLVAYFMRRCLGRTIEPSRLFLYSITRKLNRCPGVDSGADIRSTLKAMARFGLPPEKYWPYEPARFHEDPIDPFLFGYRGELASLIYCRIDRPNRKGAETLELAKRTLASGFPLVCGFPVPSSLLLSGDIDYRPSHDTVRGRQVVVIAGYDDNRHTTSRKGAMLIQSSWKDWGCEGTGWLPYDFVLEGLAADLWTILHPDWLPHGDFSSPV